MKSTTALILTALFSISSLSSAKVELSPLTTNVKMWETNSRNFADRFSWLDWRQGYDDYTRKVSSKDLTFWKQQVAGVKLKEIDGVLRGLKIEILNQENSLMMTSVAFNQRASQWKLLLDDKLGSAGNVISPTYMAKIKHTRVAWKCEGCIVILSANIGLKPDRLELSFHEKTAGLASVKLKGQQDAEFLANLKNGTRSDESSGAVAGSKEEKDIRSMIREILARKAPNGVSNKVQDAVNLLNVYRYLSSVPYHVKATSAMIKASEDAAMICRKKGSLSHNFGHSTDKCNLAMDSRNLTMENSVMQYMQDSGANNRAKRGHRRWCINHKMGKTGFGLDGAYSAMYSLDQSARGGSKNYSYPGHGFYPIKYLHGNGWSYHLAKGKAPGNCEVEVWRLRRKEDRMPHWGKEPDGTKLPCAYVNTYSDTIVFEPQKSAVTKKGYYLVRLKGSGFKEQYLVKLF